MFNKFNKIFNKVEKSGFNIANKAHQYTVNVILLGISYCLLTSLKNYNDTFREAREYSDYFENEKN